MEQEQTIVFVCEHGSAKSVVAAAHFNRLAAERGLELRADSRGRDPDAEIAPNAEVGLRADGLVVVERSPAKLTQADAAVAARIVSFCEAGGGIQPAAARRPWESTTHRLPP